MSTTFDIIIPGHYFCDVIFTHMQTFPSLGSEIYSEGVKVVAGGGALNTSIGLRRLGINVAWMGTLGTDFFSQYVKNTVQHEQLDTTLVEFADHPLERVTVALSYPTDRAFITYVQQPPALIQRVFDALNHYNLKHLHFSSLVIHEDMPDLLRACKARGIRVSMDCQQREETLEMPLVRAILQQTDLFMPNASEAWRITGETNLDSALDKLAQLVNTVIVKDGANGAYGRIGSQVYHSPAFPVTPLDTTGAGDSFNAGFLAAHLQGKPIAECLRWGNYCGAQSTLDYGASNAPHSIPDA